MRLRRRFLVRRFFPPSRIVPVVAVWAVILAAGRTGWAAPRPDRPAVDPRWSLVYVLEAEAGTPAPGPVVPHSSVVQRAARPPQNSPDVAVLPSSTVTQSENSVAVHPADPDIVFVANNATDWPVTQVFGTGVYWSTDGGATWTGNDHGPGGVGNSGDPATAIRGLDGRWVVGYIHNNGGQGASYTTDGGATWVHRIISSSSGLDKNHLETDNVAASPHYGNLYSSWTNLGGGPNDGNIEFTRSVDGGDTWSTPVNISTGVGAGSHDQGVNIRTGPNGEVYVTWAIYDSWPSDETAIGFNKSTDGGVTWVGEFRAITNIRGHRSTSLPNTSIRRNSFPSMAVDVSGGPNDGAVYVVWTNQGVPGINVGDPDIYLAKSVDGGATFGAAVRVNQDATTNAQWFPWVSCDPVTGQLAVIFYDRRDDPGDSLTRTYMAVSNDGGATWDDFPVGDVSFTPVPIPGLAGGYMGDYLGVAIQGGRAYPTWSDNRTGNFLCYVSPILVSDPTDPNPPTGVTASSDYTTPTTVLLGWTDPTTFADGTPLGNFSVDISRDDVFLVNVDQGIETYLDAGLLDGQQYKYTLQARDDVTDSLSVAVNVFVHAGGSPIPGAPTGPACSADSVSATITWTNPTTQEDGTTLDDFAGIRVYRDGSLLVELARAPSDTGSADSYVDSPPAGFVYSYEVAAIDSEVPVNESARAAAGQCFVGNVPNILVWQPTDAISNSGTVLFNTLSSLGESAFLTSNLFEFSPDLNAHEIVIAVIGIYSNNHIITGTEGAALDSFVQDGGRLILEGGDCFNYDPESAGGYDIRPIFGLADGPDGSADLSGVFGLNDLAGFSFVYGGANNFIDELQPISSIPIFQNDANADLVTVFMPSYFLGRSIGASFEFGGLVDAGARLETGVPAPRSSRILPPVLYEGPPLSQGPDPLKLAAFVSPEERGEVPVTKRAANTQEWVPTDPARRAGGPGAIVGAANTKVDLMAAYLTLLRATGDPVLSVSADSVQTTIFQDATDTKFFTVDNPGTLNDNLIFTITESPAVGWLTATPAADTLGANGSSIITVDFDATGLQPGMFTTDLIVSSNDPVNPTHTVSVVLNVLGIPAISVTPDSVYFNVAPLATAEDSVTISNLGLGDLDYSLFLVGSGGADRYEVPAVTSSSPRGNAYRGNIYQVDAGVPLKQIDQYLGILSPTELEFFVYENTAASGTFTKIFSVVLTSGTGEGWHSSGPIDVLLEPGKFYFIGAGWLGVVTYFHDGGTTPLPAPVGFGSVLGPSGSNSYPPPATKPIAAGGAILWAQAVEYGVPANLEILSATSGTVPPSGSTVVSLRATGGPDPGIFESQLHISSNDPLAGSVIVPVTIEVSDPTAAPSVGMPIPTVFALHPSAPNPFRGDTRIRFDLPRTAHVALRVYDVTGRLVRTLLDRPEEAGYRTVLWDGRDSAGRRVGSGVYFYSLDTGDRVLRRKMVVLR